MCVHDNSSLELKVRELYVLNKKNYLYIFLTGNIHCHANEILKVALEELCLHLQVCFCDVTSQWCVPKEAIKLF